MLKMQISKEKANKCVFFNVFSTFLSTNSIFVYKFAPLHTTFVADSSFNLTFFICLGSIFFPTFTQNYQNWAQKRKKMKETTLTFFTGRWFHRSRNLSLFFSDDCYNFLQ
jgi:hypothetical protein